MNDSKRTELMNYLDGFETLSAAAPELSHAFVKRVTGNTQRAGREFVGDLQGFFEQEGLTLDEKQVLALLRDVLLVGAKSKS